MKYLVLFLVFCGLHNAALSTELSQIFSYTEPVPAAELVCIKTGLILRPAAGVNISQFFTGNLVSLSGSLSGTLNFTKIHSDDESVILLKPDSAFKNAETITVTIAAGVVTPSGTTQQPVTYTFKTRLFEYIVPPLIGLRNELSEQQIDELLLEKGKSYSGDFPDVTISYSDQPSPGYLFLSNIVFSPAIPNVSNIIMLNNNGTPHFYRNTGGSIYNFDRQSSSILSYFDQSTGKYYYLNNAYAKTDSFSAGNGYTIDLHEFRTLPNGHVLLFCYDPEAVDMSLITPGGKAEASVVGLVIQELDRNKNVVFQWRSWDHFNILDATHEDFTAPNVDYVHGNALEHDLDGNILLSSRHLDEITKIDRVTGNIIWRLGGKNNQFTFTNDPTKFSHQHCVRRIANGHIIMFDNGNYHPVPHSRAVEYSLDEVNKTATVTWQYRNTPDIFGYAMGSVQRLPNNNTLICWGSTNPTLTEVKNDGTKELVLTFDQGIFSYRAFRYDWTDSLTGIIPVSSVSESFLLSQNYPNPFNPSTTLKFSIPLSRGVNAVGGRGVLVRLSVFNALGQQVAVLVNQQLQPGTYEITWDASGFPSGVYFCRLDAGDYSQSKKMLLIK